MSTALPIKHKFELPDGLVYMDGNSLGPLPVGLNTHLDKMLRAEWGSQLIRGWNDAGWMEQPTRVGNRIGKLIGAPEGTVVVGDTLSIKVYQALGSALMMRPDRFEILSDTGNFPTDLYMAEGLIDLVDKPLKLRTVAPELIEDAISTDTAVVLLTEVDYRTGRLHDMQAITEAAHRAGAVMIWDLAHSAGAIPVNLTQSQCEFAVGCTYKYLNGGPGAPAFVYVRSDLVNEVKPTLSGWLGHDSPFAFEPDYRPAPNIERMRVGTPPVMQVTALEYALSLWDDFGMQTIRARSIQLSELFIAEVESRCPALSLVSPRDATARGSQVSFSYEHGYSAMQALIDKGVIGDFRAPDIMRFGITPLYLDEVDIVEAASRLQFVLETELWREEKYQIRSRVT